MYENLAQDCMTQAVFFLIMQKNSIQRFVSGGMERLFEGFHMCFSGLRHAILLDTTHSVFGWSMFRRQMQYATPFVQSKIVQLYDYYRTRVRL